MTPNTPAGQALKPCPMQNLRSTVGERIRYLREGANQSLQDVATAVGCSKSHIHELESGKSNNPTINLLRGLAIHFMVPVTALVETPVTAQYQSRHTADIASSEGNQEFYKILSIMDDVLFHPDSVQATKEERFRVLCGKLMGEYEALTRPATAPMEKESK
jgi:transcriptional regulator with XRE-family HTH domain